MNFAALIVLEKMYSASYWDIVLSSKWEFSSMPIDVLHQRIEIKKLN